MNNYKELKINIMKTLSKYGEFDTSLYKTLYLINPNK